MKSLFPLIILLALCFSLSLFLKRMDGLTVTEKPKIHKKEADRILNSFFPIKKSESFVVKDESGKKYEISEQEELYNLDGELIIGKHDSTNYASLLENVKNEYEEIKNQTPARCDDSIKCIADFGTNVGQDLCCGQTGVLQDTRYVCPSNKPTCTKFKCGSEFGTCS
jgi:hypothetical protein